MNRFFILSHTTARQNALMAVAHAPDGYEVSIRERVSLKSRQTEKKYHAMIGEISEGLGGELADKEDAKRILVSAFKIDTRNDLKDEWAKFGDVRMGRGLRGEVVVLGAQTKRFPQKLANAFIEWLNWFAADNGIVLNDGVAE
jgi:NinB protein